MLGAELFVDFSSKYKQFTFWGCSKSIKQIVHSFFIAHIVAPILGTDLISLYLQVFHE
jgi:hypothetical protein